MRASSHDRLLELRHRVLTRDPTTREDVESWPARYAREWAEKKDITSREVVTARTINPEITTLFRIRFRTDVLPTDRIVCEGVTYTINPPTELGRRQRLEIMATAIPKQLER